MRDGTAPIAVFPPEALARQPSRAQGPHYSTLPTEASRSLHATSQIKVWFRNRRQRVRLGNIHEGEPETAETSSAAMMSHPLMQMPMAVAPAAMAARQQLAIQRIAPPLAPTASSHQPAQGYPFASVLAGSHGSWQFEQPPLSVVHRPISPSSDTTSRTASAEGVVAFGAPPPAHSASHNGFIEPPMQMCTHLPQHMPRHASVPPFGTLPGAMGMGADGLQSGMAYPQACVHRLPDYASALDLGHGACALPPYMPPGVAAGGGMVNTAVPTRLPACPPTPAPVAPFPPRQCSASHAVVVQKAAYPPASVSDTSCHQQRQACTLLYPGPGQPFHASSTAEGPGQQPFNRLAAGSLGTGACDASGTPTAAIETALMGALSSAASDKEVPAPSLKHRAHDSSGTAANSGAADDPSRVAGKRKKLEHQLAKGIRELHGVDRAASETLTSHPEFKKMRANVVRKLTAMHSQLGDLAKSTPRPTEVACAQLPSALPGVPVATQGEAIAAPRTVHAPASAEMSYSALHPLLPSRPQLPMPFNSHPLRMPSLLQQEVPREGGMYTAPHGAASPDSDAADGGGLQVGAPPVHHSDLT